MLKRFTMDTLRTRRRGEVSMSPTDPTNPSEPRIERRRHPRFKATVEIELQSEKQATPLRVRTADLSLGGCYIEMIFTLEIGTKVKLALWVNDAKVSTEGTVVTRDLYVGNGIQFTGMSAEDSGKLKRLLAAAPYAYHRAGASCRHCATPLPTNLSRSSLRGTTTTTR